MAIKEEPSFAGKRLAAVRASRGYTAAQLAEMSPAEGITKTVITNLESGRKRDLTTTELVQLASALNVSPLELIVEVERPWDVVEIPGLNEPFSGLTNVEYARRASITSGHGGFDPAISELANLLIRAEAALVRFEVLKAIESAPIQGPKPDEPVLRTLTPHGEPVQLWLDDAWWDTAQGMIDAYRSLLQLRKRQSDSGGAWSWPAFDSRVEALRLRVVEILAAYPDLDYGQEDPVGLRKWEPALDPRTGRLELNVDRRKRDRGAPPDTTE